MMWIIAVFVFVILVISGLGLGVGASAARQGNAVDFALNDLAGKPIHLANYRGHPVMVNLWASWCPPCRAEMPDLIKFYNAHQADGLTILAVNSSDNADTASQFVRAQQIPFPVLYDPEGRVEQLFATDGLPSTLLIDRNGILRFSWTGQISPAILEQRVAPLLSQ